MKSRVGCCIRVFSLDMGLLGCGIALLSGIGYGRFFLLLPRLYERRFGSFLSPLDGLSLLGRLHSLYTFDRSASGLVYTSRFVRLETSTHPHWVRVGLAGRTGMCLLVPMPGGCKLSEGVRGMSGIVWI